MDASRPERPHGIVAAALLMLALGACTPIPAVVPTIVLISAKPGDGEWLRPTTPGGIETFAFTEHSDIQCATPTDLCEQRFPDSVFIDFSIPSGTDFQVMSGATQLTMVSPTAPVGDNQYRQTELDNGSGKSTTWRIAAHVPKMTGNPPAPRSICPGTQYDLAIFDTSSDTAAPKAGPLSIQLLWNFCHHK